jgi:hypothetical protein
MEVVDQSVDECVALFPPGPAATVQVTAFGCLGGIGRGWHIF